jgi:steroid 5-alpha reductase family enzyme
VGEHAHPPLASDLVTETHDAAHGDVYPIGRGLAGLGRPAALSLVAAAYLLAGVLGVVAAAALSGWHPIAAAFWGDLVATVVIFLLSVVLGNASLYDPYWSVAPPVIAVGWLAAVDTGLAVRQLLVIALIALWAVRLTANWASGWRGLSHEDWRYVQLRVQTRGRLPWWVVSFGGIQLMPTLVVFAGMLSVWPALAGDRPLGPVDLLAAAVTLGAVALETVADLQLHHFTNDPANRGRVAEVGVWRRTRHPNYLGEIGFWWGLWLFGLAAAPSWWWTVVGPLTMVALFVFASIPLMERRSLARRPDYADYAARVPALLPLRWRT